MDKMESRNKRKNKLIYYITIPLSLLLIIANLYFIKYNTNLKQNNKQKQDELTQLNQKIDFDSNELTKFENELTELKNIDNKINNIKKEYYQTLKIFEDKVTNKELNYKIAYLTFDDGPYYLTHKFLEVLEKHNVKGTFFTIGLDKDTCYDNRTKSCKEVYQKITKQGHTIANHTYSHLIFNGLYSSTNSFIDSVKKQENLIKERTGITTNIVRFPGGIASSGHLKNDITEELRTLGYGWVDWTASNGDGGYIPNKETAMNNFKKTINEYIEVILFHDYNHITLSMLPEAIEYLQKNNYILLPLFYESKMVNK